MALFSGEIGPRYWRGAKAWVNIRQLNGDSRRKTEMTAPKLTAQVKAGGCASKLSPKILEQALSCMPRQFNENVLVGFDTADDAGIYRLSPDLALVQTVDFFTPVVDDPFTFGAI